MAPSPDRKEWECYMSTACGSFCTLFRRIHSTFCFQFFPRLFVFFFHIFYTLIDPQLNNVYRSGSLSLAAAAMAGYASGTSFCFLAHTDPVPSSVSGFPPNPKLTRRAPSSRHTL